jgi:hypothetical protein
MNTIRRKLLDKEKGLITLEQIEDYLIYHCPLLRTTPMDTHYSLTNQQLKEHPFMVRFSTDTAIFTAIGTSPWECYRELAEMLYDSIGVHEYITELYYLS